MTHTILPSSSFSEMLHVLRRRSGLKQKDVAIAAGLDQSYFASFENGRRAPPSLEALHKILDAIEAGPEDRATLLHAAFWERSGHQLEQLLPQAQLESLREHLYQLVKKDQVGIELLSKLSSLPDEKLQLLVSVASWPSNALDIVSLFASLPPRELSLVTRVVAAAVRAEQSEEETM
ncbi:helix-turn-helix domain-containing protein [Cupriavidus sp. TMH.W2]|uniref:helix-turn-helix domain-containing protein n=1 Tax=Cupriavidus sp. TMH.W2 TaxID=3434465 RepID=UPI003D77F1CE